MGSTEIIAARDMLTVTLPLEGFHRRRAGRSSSSSSSNSSSSSTSSSSSRNVGKHSIASAVQLPLGYIKGAGMLGQFANAEMHRLHQKAEQQQQLNSAHTARDSTTLSSGYRSSSSSSSGTRSSYRGSTTREDGVAALF
jgi:hypothetical protein